MTDKSNNVRCKMLCCLNEPNVAQCNILHEKWKRYEVHTGSGKQVPASWDGRPEYRCDLRGVSFCPQPHVSCCARTPRVPRCLFVALRMDTWGAAGHGAVPGTVQGSGRTSGPRSPVEWCETPRRAARIQQSCPAAALLQHSPASPRCLPTASSDARCRARCCVTLLVLPNTPGSGADAAAPCASSSSPNVRCS